MMHAASTAYSISAPVLSCCSRVIAGEVELLPFGGEVHHLPARHAVRPRRARELEHQLGAHPRILVRGRMREDFERQRVQAVAGKHRRRLAERLVHRRLAAPQLGIVHARQIVVDQRIDMDRLDRAADAERPLRSIANRREAAMVSSGRRRLPPPIAAWRIAS